MSLEEVKIKEDFHAWYQGLEYEEGFGPGEVPSFPQKKMQINTDMIINACEHSERQKMFGEDEDLDTFF